MSNSTRPSSSYDERFVVPLEASRRGAHRARVSPLVAMMPVVAVVGIVVAGRGIGVDSVRALADGRIFTGQQAYGNGLVDTLGTLDTAIRLAGTLGKIAGEPRVTREREKETMLDLLVGARARQSIEKMGTRLGPGSPLEYRLFY